MNDRLKQIKIGKLEPPGIPEEPLPLTPWDQRRLVMRAHGKFWGVFPWALIRQHKLRFSLLEFWIVSVLWAGATGLLYSGLASWSHFFSWYFSALLLYFVFHTFLGSFASALYMDHLWNDFPEFRPRRWQLLFAALFWPTMTWYILGLVLRANH